LQESLSLSHKNAITEGANMRPGKAVRRDERCQFVAQIDKRYYKPK